MIKAVKFTETKGSDKFKQFIMQPFTIDMLYPVFNDKSCETLFDGWRGKDMLGWHKFTNDEKIVLEFYPTYYTVRKEVKNSGTYMISIPVTIDDFISDMKRMGVQLYWTNWIDLNFEPKDYLHVDEIHNYFVELLRKMGKSQELQ
jgi:hypothetical protein